MSKFEFSFDIADAIELRKQVLTFYSNMCGKNAPNVVNEKEPWLDVMSDWQCLMYMYLMNQANEQIQIAETMTNEKGKRLISGEAKNMLTYYKRDYQQIRAYFPINNMTWLSQYAEVMELMEDRIKKITEQTYYSMLQTIYKATKDADSCVSQCTARMITGLVLMVMSLEKGMYAAHNVRSIKFTHVINRMCRLVCWTVSKNNANIAMDDDLLAKHCETASQVVINIAQPLLDAIGEHARSMNMYHYVKSADYTLSEYNQLVANVKRAQTPRLCVCNKEGRRLAKAMVNNK